MPSRRCILQEVFKELREHIRVSKLEGDIKGFCFESQKSSICPVKIRWRICHPGRIYEQVGNVVGEECWKIAEHKDFR